MTEKKEEKKVKIPIYNREKMWPGSHQCSHFTTTFNRNCERPAYKKGGDGRWWCDTCWVLNSGEVDKSTLPLYRNRNK